MTYVEAKFSLRIRDSKPSDTGLTLSRQSKEKGHPFRVLDVFMCDGGHFQRNCNASKNAGKAIKASHGPRVGLQSQAEERVKRTMENPKGSPREQKVRSKFPKAQATLKH